MADAQGDSELTLKPWAVARMLAVLALALILASAAGQLAKFRFGHSSVHGLVNLFSVDEEQNLPALFSVILLLFATALLMVIARFKTRERAPDASRWVLLSAGFLFMAVDEAASFHERLIEPVRSLLGRGDKGIFYFAWVIPGIGLVALLAPIFLRFMQRLPRKTGVRFLIAASLFLGGAVGMELVGGRYAEKHGNDLTYNMFATIEEGLEMAGVIVFIHALLGYLAETYGQVRFRFSGTPIARGSERVDPTIGRETMT